MNKPGRPRKLTEESNEGKIISDIRYNHRDWSIRDIEKKIPDFSRKLGLRLTGKVSGHTAIGEFIKKVVDPNIAKIKVSGVENIWTTATLNNEPISPDAIYWLIWLQEYYRKFYYSKPLTIREARWFNRLLGFREDFSYLLDMEIPQEQKNVFLSHIIATWAQVYAYREKIDAIAGVIEPDNSDLDSDLITGHPSATNDYNEKWLWDALPITPEELSNVNSVSTEEAFRISRLNEGLMTKMSKERLTKWKDKYLLPSMIDANRFIEICILRHSLGTPDMSDNSINSYSGGLLVFKDDAIRQRLMELPYIRRIRFIVLLREWAKEHPDAAEAIIKPKVKEILDKVEKDGEENG